MYRLFAPVIIPFQEEIIDTRSHEGPAYGANLQPSPMWLYCHSKNPLCKMLASYRPQACTIVPHWVVE